MTIPIAIYMSRYGDQGEEVRAVLRKSGSADEDALGSLSYPGTQLQVELHPGCEIVLRIVKREPNRSPAASFAS